MSNLDKALEWANGISYHPCSHEPEEVEAARIILNLPDQWVDTEKIQKWYDQVEELLPYWARDDFNSLLTPKLPTLAELIEAGNDPKQYQLMQCKESHFPTGGTGAQGIILSSDEISSLILERNGAVVTWPNSLVTPLQGEPKLKWPGSEATVSNKEKATADQQPSTSENPKSSIKPEDVPPNEPWLIEADGQKAIGTRYKGDAYAPWAVAALNGSFVEDYPDYEITLIHKLVPETS